MSVLAAFNVLKNASCQVILFAKKWLW